MEEITGRNLIAGEAVRGGGEAFRAVDPATGKALDPEFTGAGARDVARAMTAAEAAFRAYARSSGQERARLLRAIADAVMALGERLLQRANLETGLPPARLDAERTRTVNQLRMFADLVEDGSWVEARIDTGDPSRKPGPAPDIRRMLVPLGPVAVFSASNFPLAFSVAGGDTASALAAGCPVVCKAHPGHPGTSELVGGAIGQAVASLGLPAGMFSLVHGWSHEVGLALVRHPLTRAVGFTGSLRGGRAVFDAAATRPDPIPVYAEMGSVNPVFLLPSAVAERWESLAAGLAHSITLGVGQFCTKPGVIVAQCADGLDSLLGALAERIRNTPAGAMLYDRLAHAYAGGVERARAMGAELLAVASPAHEGPTGGRPALLSTDVGHFLEEAEMRAEVFGPSSLAVVAADAAEMMKVAEALEGQLTVTIHGTAQDLVTHAALVDVLRRKAGRLIFNGYPTGVEVGHAMQHGGPYPASIDSRSTSVGTAAIARFARPVCYQDFPEEALPLALRNHNALGIWRLVNGEFTRADVGGASRPRAVER